MAAGIPTQFQIGAKVSASTAASNYKTNASQKGQWWATKYLMAKRNPFQAASDSAQTWLANVNNAGTQAYQAGLARVDQGAVAQLVATQGPTLYAQGINNKGATKYAKAATGLIPALQQAAANLPPRGSLSQNIARSTQMIQAAAAMRGLHRG